jgi:two-component system OmpR family response regulator
MADLLLVENDPRILELMTFFLERAGHAVRTATSFADARASIRERPPDLLLSDLEMGRESGREELPRIAREEGLPPTLVVSGYVDRESAEALGRVPGVVGTLSKPFDMARLVAKVGECLSRAAETSREGGRA